MCTANTTRPALTAASIRAARDAKIPATSSIRSYGIGCPDSYDVPVQCVRCEHWCEKRKCAKGVCVVCQREQAEAV